MNQIFTNEKLGGFKYFLFSPPKIREDEPSLTNVVQLGWNDQLACFSKNSPTAALNLSI